MKTTRYEPDDTGYTWTTKPHNCTWRVLEDTNGRKVPLCYFGGKTVSIRMKWGINDLFGLHPSGLEIEILHSILF